MLFGMSGDPIPQSPLELMAALRGVRQGDMDLLTGGLSILEGLVKPGVQARETEWHFLEGLLRIVASEKEPDAELIKRLEARAATFRRQFVEMFSTLGEHGFFGMGMPEEYGGSDYPPAVADTLVSSLEMVDPGMGTSFGASKLLCAAVIARHGTPEQKDEFLRPLLTGKMIGALGLTEPHGGTDSLGNPQTKWHEEGDEIVLSGGKCFITNGGFCGVIIIYAGHRDQGRMGTTFLVPTLDQNGEPRKGLSFGRPETKEGQRSSPTTTVSLDEVRIPASYRLGEIGQGATIIRETLVLCRTFVGDQPIAALFAVLGPAIEHLRNRTVRHRSLADSDAIHLILGEAFGKAVTMLLAEIGLQTVMTRTDPPTNPQLLEPLTAAFKVTVAKMGFLAVNEVVQAFGGDAYIEESFASIIARSMRVLRTYEGSEWALMVLALWRALEFLVPKPEKDAGDAEG